MAMTAVLIVLSAAAATAGYRIASRSNRLSIALCVGSVGLVLVKVAGAYILTAEPRLFPFDFYPYVEPWWYAVPALFLFGAGLFTVRQSLWKRDGILVAGGLLLVYVTPSAWATGESHENLWGTVSDQGVCLQTSSYSCSPAAVAGFLHRFGVQATEQEMARLCVTRSWISGTSDSGIIRGLRRKLPGRRVSIV